MSSRVDDKSYDGDSERGSVLEGIDQHPNLRVKSIDDPDLSI
jgi:hypothetical protein